LVSAIEFLFIPVAINSNDSTNTPHDHEIIGIFNESLWDYPVNHYVDPNEPPGPGNSLAFRLYNNYTFNMHFLRMTEAMLAYDGVSSPYFDEPYVVVVKPRKKTTFLPDGETEVEFEISPYEQSTTPSYTWFVDGEEQDAGASQFSHSFTY
jgi:hypothetical protein